MRRIAAMMVLVGLIGCKTDSSHGEDDPALNKWKRTKVAPRFSSQAILHERSGTGEIAYLGMDIDPAEPSRGEVVTVTHYFRVIQPVSDQYDVFVHGDVPGTGERIFVADHSPVVGRLPTNAWRTGDIWADQHKVAIPENTTSGTIEIFAGLYKGEARFTVEAFPQGSDGHNRIRVGTIALSGAAPKDDLVETVVARTSVPIKIDGKLDDEAWSKATVLEFFDTMGRGAKVRYPTKLRLLYDDTNLYVGFDSVDVDVTERYSKRDDPIYDHETVEVFLMPNVVAPALGPYVELQASPGGVIFDASFDGRRMGMNKGFDAGQTIATTIDGTLNTETPDRGWVSEWAVPWKNIRGVTSPPKPGDEWRMNAFRIEKYREGGKLQGEYTAWSPPMIGDFHNVARFGRMKFGS